MKLIDLFHAVKEESLTKDQLEHYRNELCSLYAEMKLEFADLEKAEAMYLLNVDAPNWTAKKANWKGTPHGQRMITLKNYLGATNKVIDSLKSRLYSIY